MKLRILLLLSFLIQNLQASEEPLVLDTNAGNYPLEVSVKGPEKLSSIDIVEPGIFVGCGFTLDWGDGSAVEPKCQDTKKHVYTTPGTYTVIATIWHPGPSDESITTWVGRAIVNVTGKAETRSYIDSITLSGNNFGYEELPEVSLKIVSSEANDIIIDLLTIDERVVNSFEDKGISFTGEKKYRIFSSSYRSNSTFHKSTYDQEILSGNEMFKVRARLLKNNNVVSEVISDSFISSAEIRSENIRRHFTVIYQDNSDSFEIEARYEAFHPNCFNYILDWGDGSEAKIVENEVPKSCPLDKEIISLGHHKYKKPGHYVLKLKTNSFNLWGRISNVPSYISKTVDIE